MLRWKSSLKPAAAAPSGDNPGTTNLKGWWSLDDASGNFADSHTSSTPLTASGTLTYSQTGVVSNAVDFDGSSGYGSATADVISDYPFSASGWFKTTATGTDVMFYFGRFDAGNTYHILFINSSGQAQLTSRLVTQVNTTSSSTYNDGTWHHIAGVWHSATERRLYIDGSEVAGGTGLTSLSFVSSTANGVALGRSNDDTPGSYFDGTLDEWCFFDDALTANEITWLYNSGSGRSYSDLSGGGPADITLEDSASTTAADFSAPTDIDVNIPAVSANDILLLLCTTNDASDPTTSPPTGWTNIVEQDGTTGSQSTVAAYWKRASSSALATTETWSSFFPAAEVYYIWVGAYSGCVTSGSPVDAYGSSATNFGTPWSVNITTTTADTMIVTISGTTNPNITHTWSDGTELIDTAYVGTNAAVSINEKLEATTGSKTRTVTPSATTGNAMAAVALRSADSYLIDENFDDNLLPSDWTFTSDGGNSYTVSGGLLSAVNESDYVTFDVPAAMQDEFWVKALIDNVGGTPSKASWYSFIEVLDSSSVEFISAQFWGQEPPYGSGTYRLDGATTVASLAQSIFANSYYVWFHFVKNGTSELWVSQSSTRPTTDSTSECVISCSTDNTSADKIKLKLGYANGTRPIYWDFFIGDESDTD